VRRFATPWEQTRRSSAKPTAATSKPGEARHCSWCRRPLRRGMGKRIVDGEGFQCRRPCSWRPEIVTRRGIPVRWMPPDREEAS
jgi:hypothetical protein